MNTLDIPLPLRLPKETAKTLEGTGVATAGSLLLVASRRYYHWDCLTLLSSLREDEDATILAEVTGAHLVANRSNSGVRLEVTLTDDVQFLSAVFFVKNQYKLTPIERLLMSRQSFLFAGKVGVYRGKLQLTHPSLEGVDEGNIERTMSCLIPIYPAAGPPASWAIAQAIGMVLDHLNDAHVFDPVSVDVRERAGFASHADYLHAFHQPETDENYQQARKALAFVEAFVPQVGLAAQCRGAQIVAALASPIDAPLCGRFRSPLPLELIGSQREAVAQIGTDLAGEVPMQRFLQGNVGPGKTVVALSALLQVVAADYRGAFVAPTEILAEQRVTSLWVLLESLGAGAPDARLLTGSVTPAARREA